MKIYLLLISLFIISSFTNAQYINNGGFETWSTGDPTGWQSPNSTTQGFGVTVVSKETTDVHSGLNSAKLETKNVIIYAVPGMLTNGTINVVPTATPPVAIAGGVPFTQRPANFTGYYKYTPGSGDVCYISVFLLKRNTGTGNVDTIGYAQFTNTAAVSAWTQFTAPFTYGSVEAPDTMQVLVISSNPLAPVVGSTLLVDDLDLTGGTLGVTKYSLLKSVNVFPNPASDLINIQFNSETTSQTIVSVYSLLGQKIKEITLPVGTELSSINIRDLKDGMYFVQVQIGKEKYLQKISVK